MATGRCCRSAAQNAFESGPAGVPTIVGTGAVNSKEAVSHAAHAEKVGASGLMVIPRVLSRGASPAAQKAHFSAVLGAAPSLPSVIYNSPYYGFATRADLFFELRAKHGNLIGFKEFGGAVDLRYAAEHITSQDENVTLMAGFDTQVFHGFVNCGAPARSTASANALPREVLQLVELCRKAVKGDVVARRQARELERRWAVCLSFDEHRSGAVLQISDVLNGDKEYTLHFNETDAQRQPAPLCRDAVQPVPHLVRRLVEGSCRVSRFKR